MARSACALMEAARDLGVTRFVIVSSIGTHDVAGAAEAMHPYLQAKRDADDALKQSGLEWTIVKPGHLTDAPGSGRVQVSRSFGGRADVPATTSPSCCSNACSRRTPSASSSNCSRATSQRARPSAPSSQHRLAPCAPRGVAGTDSNL